MESLSPQVISAAKLPILNPNEFDLWKMRIEQYFLMTDYSLWEVILNGDSPAPTRVIEGVLQPVALTTAEQRQARKNELKARGTLLMALPETKKVQKTLLKQQYENFSGYSTERLDQIHDRLQKLISQLEILGVSLLQEDINLKFLRRLPSEWRTHTLIWRNKTDLEEQSLNDLFNNLKIYEAEVKSSSSASTSTQNIAFVSSSNIDSTNESVSAAASVYAISAKIHVSALPNIDTDDLEEIDLKWQMAMLIVRARRFLQRTERNLEPNGPTSMGFNMSKVECYNFHKKGHFARECSYDLSFQAEEEPTNYALMALSSLSSSTDNEVVSCSKACTKAYETLFQLGNGYHAIPPPYTETFMPPKPDLVFNNAPNDVETDHLAFNVKFSPTKPDEELSQTYRPSAPIIEDWVFDSEDESETKTPQNVSSFVQSTKQVRSPRPSVQHVETSIPAATPKPASPKPISNGKRRNRKACFVCKSLDHLIKDCDYHEKKMAQPTTRNHAKRENHKHYARMSLPNPQRHVVPAAVLTQSKHVPITTVRPVPTGVPKISVTRPRQAKTVVTRTNSPPKRHINCSPSPKSSNFTPKVTAVKATMDKGVIDSGCSRHMTGNMSYQSDFEELNGGYVAFGGNPKGGKIFGKGKIRTGKLDFDGVYFVKELKFNLFSVSQMCDKKNSVLFTDTECLVLSPDFKLPDENQVLLRVPRENNMYNVNLKYIVPSGDLTCLFGKATLDESNLWHRRLGHINFKTINKLVKEGSLDCNGFKYSCFVILIMSLDLTFKNLKIYLS
uniref:Ribonuclease H-like domain-containing protein n=1 Tax=Tanacetum cinerariifolium TaxID=118510 RepID=A0A699IWH9_TANCI|nr:ribonuclease H-like domain-containing protein [Tanacetum cinerariifolium]